MFDTNNCTISKTKIVRVTDSQSKGKKMADEENQVAQETQVQEVSEGNAGAMEETKEQVAEETKVPPKRKDAEYNFAEVRRKAEAAERALELERQRNQEMMEFLKQNRQPQQSKEERDLLEEELSKLSKDDLATIDNVDKKLTKAQKHSKREVDEVKQQLADLKSQLEEQRLRVKYPDLDEVLSSDNIDALKKEDPEIAAMIAEVTDTKKQAMMAYKYIKKIIPQKEPESEDRKRAVENSKKPMSVQSVARTSPIGMANAFATMNPTKDEKKAIYKEMQEAMKRG